MIRAPIKVPKTVPIPPTKSVIGNPDYTSTISERHYRRLQTLMEDAERLGGKLIIFQGENEPTVWTGFSLRRNESFIFGLSSVAPAATPLCLA